MFFFVKKTNLGLDFSPGPQPGANELGLFSYIGLHRACILFCRRQVSFRSMGQRVQNQIQLIHWITSKRGIFLATEQTRALRKLEIAWPGPLPLDVSTPQGEESSLH